MFSVVVDIVRFVDPHQPGVVACELHDAAGLCHSFIEKVPIVSLDSLDETSSYPRRGSIRCEVIERFPGSPQSHLIRISTAQPDHVESTDGLSEFVVTASQLEGQAT